MVTANEAQRLLSKTHPFAKAVENIGSVKRTFTDLVQKEFNRVTTRVINKIKGL